MLKMRQKNAIENAVFFRVLYALRISHVLSRLARSGTRSIDSLTEKLSGVAQLKKITELAPNPKGQKRQLLG